MKKIRALLVLLIIISLGLLIYLIFFVKPVKEFTYEEYKISQEGENPELEAALKIRIFPENKDYLEENYKGNMALNYLYEKIYNLVHKNLESLQSDFKKLKIDGYNEYLNENEKNLVSMLGITNINELTTLAQNILGKNINDEEYVNSEFIKDTYKSGNNYDTINLVINYKSEKLYFKVYIVNDIITSPMIIFESINGGNE